MGRERLKGRFVFHISFLTCVFVDVFPTYTVGRPKKEVIARCRQAIKNNDVGLLFKTIQDGVP